MEPPEGAPGGVRRAPRMSSMSRDNVIVEFRPVGNAIKVVAVDPETGTEVSIVGSLSATQQELTDLAVRKLDYVLKQQDTARR